MADYVAEGNPAGSGGDGNVTRTSNLGGETFKRRDFIQSLDSGTRVEVSRRGRIETQKNNEYVMFDSETREGHRVFLDNYVHNLIRVQQENPALLDTPQRAQDKEMLRLLSKREVKNGQEITLADGRPAMEVDGKKIQELLKTHEGWAIANIAMEQYTSEMMFALSLEMSILPEGQRDVLLQRFNYLNGINQGRFSRRWSGRDPMRERAIAAVSRYFDRGKTTSVMPDKDALLSIQNSPGEAEFIRRMTGIDVRDFQVNAGGNVEAAPGVRRTQDVHAKVETILGNLYMREKFYDALGVPATKLDAMDNQFIYRLADGRREEISTHVNEKIKEQFDTDTYIRDANGLRPGETMPNPLGGPNIEFNPATVNVEDALIAYRIAKSRVFVDLVQQYSARQIQAPENMEKTVTSIGEKVKKVTGPEAGETRTKALEETRKALEERQTKISVEREPLTQYSEKLKKVQTLEQKLDKDFNLPVLPGETVETTVTRELENIRNQIEGAIPAGGGARAGGLTEQLATARENKRTFIETNVTPRIEARVAALGGRGNIPAATLLEIEEGYTEAANARYNETIDQLKNAIQTLKTRRDTLNSLVSDYRNAERERETSQIESIQDAPKNLNEIQQAYRDLIVGGIDSADLENMTVEQLIPTLTAPPFSRPFGTPEEQVSVRAEIIRAKAEIKGSRAESFEPSPLNQIDAYTRVLTPAFIGGGWFITENDILTRSDFDLLTNLEGPGGRYRWDPANRAANQETLRLARTEAQKKLRIRFGISLDEQEKNIKEQLEIIDRDKTQAVEGIRNSEGRFLQAAQELLNAERREEIFKNALDVADNIPRYTDVTVVTATDAEYTPAERDAGYPRGYFDIVNYMFDYQEDPNRENRFRNINNALPPQKLAQVLNRSFTFGLTVGGGGANELNIVNALDRLRARPNTSPREIQRALGDVMEQIKREVNAISV